VVQFGNCFFVVRDRRFQSVEARRISMSINHAKLHYTLTAGETGLRRRPRLPGDVGLAYFWLQSPESD
jgi:hypothetical protein